MSRRRRGSSRHASTPARGSTPAPRRRQPAVLAVAGAFVPLAIILWAVFARQPSHPNLLLITIDTLRADHVGAYGASSGATPALDALAAAGVRFDQAETAVPLTGPS